METNRRPAYNRQMYNNRVVVHGNTVRNPEHRRGDVQRQQKTVSRQVRKNRKNALHMNRPYVIFLTAAALIALIVCVNYLRLQSEVSAGAKDIAKLQRELVEKKEKNNARLDNAENSVNMEEVRKAAMGRLGMKHVRPDQIRIYKTRWTIM